MHFRKEYVICGKPACWCAHVGKRKANGRLGHGPYWYGYWREKGRLRKRYFGKNKPQGAPRWRGESRLPDRWSIPSRWSDAHAFRVLGIKRRKDAKAAYRKLIVKVHPDKPGGSTSKAKAVNGAWGHLR